MKMTRKSFRVFWKNNWINLMKIIVQKCNLSAMVIQMSDELRYQSEHKRGCIANVRTEKTGRDDTYLRSSCMSGPGYRISTEEAHPGTENMLRQSTRSPRLRPNRGRPSAA
jgi:hypothetical protein